MIYLCSLSGSTQCRDISNWPLPGMGVSLHLGLMSRSINFQSSRDGASASWVLTSTMGVGLMRLAQGHNKMLHVVTSTGPLDSESDTLQPCRRAPLRKCVNAVNKIVKLAS